MGLNSNSKVWPESVIQGIVDEGFYVIVYDNCVFRPNLNTYSGPK